MNAIRVVIVGAGIAGLSTAYNLHQEVTKLNQSLSSAKSDQPTKSAPKVELKLTILEARDRLGGRVHTVKMGDVPIDLGASWLHGVKGNPLTDIAKLAKFDLGPLDSVADLELNAFDSDGKDVNTKFSFVVEEYDKIEDELHKRSENLGSEAVRNSLIASGKDRSVQSAFEQLLTARRRAILDRAKKLGLFQQADAKQEEKKAGAEGKAKAAVVEDEDAKIWREIELHLDSLCDIFASYHNGSMAQVSFAGLHDEKEWQEKGGDRVVRNGYSVLVDFLLRNTPSVDVRLKHVVQSISFGLDFKAKSASDEHKHTTEPPIVVKTDQGSFEADFVVVAVPLGILKANTIAFSPPLSEIAPAKVSAIERLGFGVLDKVVLRFTHAFWEPALAMASEVKTKDAGSASAGQSEERKCKPAKKGKGKKGKDKATAQTAHARELSDITFLPSLNPSDHGPINLIWWWNHYRVARQPVLFAWLGADRAETMEKLEDAVIIKHAIEVLSRKYGDLPRKCLVESRVTRWRADQFARGSYSFLAVHSRAGDRDELARSIRNCHFAGEATNRVYPATVHGAFHSGLREAGKIAKKIKARLQVTSSFLAASSPAAAPATAVA